MQYPEYSDNVVALARAYDQADMLCRSGLWYFQQMKEDSPGEFGTFENEDDPAWVNHHMEMLDGSLAGMRKVLATLIIQETQPLCQVELDDQGYVIMPTMIKALLPDPDAYKTVKVGWPVDQTSVADQVAAMSEGRKAIVWYDEVFFFPKDMPSSFIEVWWRRFFRGPDRDCRMYPLYLKVNDAYGWDCIGIER